MPLYFILSLVYFTVLLLSCLLTGWLLVRKSWPLEYKLLVVLCSLTFLVEMSADLLVIHRIYHFWLYNLFAPVECGFILYIFYRGSTDPAVKRLNVLLLACLPPGIAVTYFLHPVFFRLNEPAALLYLFWELIGACAVVIGILLNKSDSPLGHQPLFWMACGILFYCCIFTLIHAVMNVMPKIQNQYFTLYSFFANTFMYSGFIASFCSLRRVNRAILV